MIRLAQTGSAHNGLAHAVKAKTIAVLAAFVAALATMLILAPVARAETAAAFMQRAANDLVAANRAQSPMAYASALRRYGDLPGIGLSSLGNYASALPKSDRPLYYSGVVNFISKYVASQSATHAVDRVSILGQGEEDATGVAVETRIWLKNGQEYDVRWRLMRSGASFKIRDAQVLGQWVSPYIADLFQKYITENQGSPKALIIALNRYGGGSMPAEAAAR